MYIAIDGDDTGRKIAACYLNNEEAALARTSELLKQVTFDISHLLSSSGFDIIFCAADGVAARTKRSKCDLTTLFARLQGLAPHGLTFSAGVGDTLQEAYIALLNAKSSGKNKLCCFSDMKQ